MATKDLIGQKFGRLTVIGKNSERSPHRYVRWDCLCDCGGSITVVSNNLATGDTTSCGCYRKEVVTQAQTTHGMSSTTEYSSWQNMLNRCTNPNEEAYKNYGGRGITVCERWLNSFENFFADMGFKPGPEYSIERRENNRGYSPDNCHWATRGEQNNNKRNNVLFEYNGETKTIKEWSVVSGINYDKLHARLMQFNWDFERAIKTP